MLKKSSFYPPRLNLKFVKFIHFILPFFCKFALNNLQVQISDKELEHIATLKDKHLLLLPNHPTEDDPYVFLEISRRLGFAMNSVAARETFDWNGGLRGKGFQMLGCYSLIRGAPDRESFMTTKSLLAQGKRPLVIFIEGEVSNQNDVLIPFEPGVVQLAFKAQEEIHKDTLSVNLLPLTIKYRYKDIEPQIIKSIERLEKATGIKASSQDLIARIRSIGEKILAVQERRLNLKSSTKPNSNPESEGLDLTERIDQVKSKLLSNIESFLDIKVDASSGELERIRTVRNTMDRLSYAYDKPEELSAYEERVLEHLNETFKEFYEELDRLVNFLVLDGDYLSSKNTPERFVEVLKRLEKEVFGKPIISGARTAHVRLGNTVALSNFFEEYKTNKKETAIKVTTMLEADMKRMLNEELFI